MSNFTRRALRKSQEHLRCDKTGWSLLKYGLKWLFSKTIRMTTARLKSPRLERFAKPRPDRVMIAVKITGGIGDYVIIARALRDIGMLSDSIRFHVFCSSVSSGEWVFKNLRCVEGVFDGVWFSGVRSQYDCTMHMNQFVYYDEESLNLAKIMRMASSLADALARCQKARRQWDVFIDRHPTLDGAFAHQAVALGHTRYTFIHSELGLPPGNVELDLCCDFSVANDLAGRFGQWITINTGFDAHFAISSRLATKCYPARHWERFVKSFKRQHPDVAVVQVGAKTSVPISGVDIDLIGATSLAQVAAILRRSLLHVDNEGGLVHVAACLGTKSVVLFGPTPVRYFGYAGNANLSAGTCGDCWWATERWMEICPRGHVSPRCLEEIAPSQVLNAAAKLIDQARSRSGATSSPDSGSPESLIKTWGEETEQPCAVLTPKKEQE